MSQGPAIRASE